MTLDLRKDEGRALLRRLLPHFDVLSRLRRRHARAVGLAPEISAASIRD